MARLDRAAAMIGTVIRSALVLPTPRALLPPHSRQDPVAELRVACTRALAELLVAVPDVWVVTARVAAANRANGIEVALGHRVAQHLLAAVGSDPATAHLLEAGPTTVETLRAADGVLLVMADGSARRHQKAPGHLHPDAVGFDRGVEVALQTGDAAALAELDPGQAEELWCEGVPALRVLGGLARGRSVESRVTYADAPHGVAWWVARWDLA